MCFALGYPVWNTLGFLNLGDYFVPYFRESFNYYIRYFLMPFIVVFFFWDTYSSNIGVFNIDPEVSEIVLTSFNSLFSFFLAASFISTILSSTSLIFSSASVILPLVPSRVLFVSVIELFIIDWLFLFILGPC